MNLATKKSSLSPARQKLLRLMQSVNFGRIEQLRVSGGEPVFAPPPIWRLRRNEAARRCEIRRKKSADSSENGLEVFAPRSPVVPVEPLEKGVEK